MTALIALVRKDLILFVSDRRALVLSLIMPIILASFFGFLFGGSGDAKTSKIEIALVQLDDSDISKKIAAGLKGDASLKVSELTRAEADKQVREGKQKAAIVIPAGFGAAAGAALFNSANKPEIALLYDPSQAAVLAMVKGMLTQQVMQVVSADMFNGKTGQAFTDKSIAQMEQSGAHDAEATALKEFLGSLKKYQNSAPPKTDAGAPAKGGLSMPFTTRDQAVVSKDAQTGYNAYAHSFAGMSVQFILFMGIDMGVGILLARRSGVWNRLLAAPVTLTMVLMARAISAALIAFALLCLIFFAAMLIFKVQVSNPLGFLGIGLCFACMTASFGLFIAAFGKTPEGARSLSMFATLILVMLGGAWIPSFMFPQWIQSLTVLIPTRWAIDGFDAMTWRGLGLDFALQAMLVQAAFAVVFGGLAIWKFRSEQQ